MQDAIKESLQDRSLSGAPSTAPRKATAAVRRSIQLDERNLRETIAGLRMEDVEQATELLARADYINVVGFRTSFSLAYLLYFLLRQLHPRIRLLDDTGGGFADHVAAMGAQDVLIALSFPRYI